MTPLAPERFAVQFSIERSTHDLLRDVQSLLGHQVLRGDVAAVFHRALESLKRDLEKGKFAATTQPRPRQHRPSRNPRHIPAEVKRAVWERDQGRCTFVSDAGRRCDARHDLEFDHVDPVARGGAATVGRMRLRCRAHNQYEAERTFGAEFMNGRRERARHERAAARARVVARAEATANATRTEGTLAAGGRDTAAAHVAAEQAGERDVTPWLRQLGFRADEARRAAEFCETIRDASLEERVRAALSFLARPRRLATNQLGTAARAQAAVAEQAQECHATRLIGGGSAAAG